MPSHFAPTHWPSNATQPLPSPASFGLPPLTEGFDLPHLAEELAALESVPRLLELYAERLTRYVPVKLVAFGNPHQNRSYLVCPGQPRYASLLFHNAWEVLQGAAPRQHHWRQGEWLYHLWLGQPLGRWERLLLIETGGGLDAEDTQSLLQNTLPLLYPALQARLRGSRLQS